MPTADGDIQSLVVISTPDDARDNFAMLKALVCALVHVCMWLHMRAIFAARALCVVSLQGARVFDKDFVLLGAAKQHADVTLPQLLGDGKLPSSPPAKGRRK